MRFSVFLPPQSRARRVPVLYYLAGLTCTEETFVIKAGAQRVAAELGLVLVAPRHQPAQPRASRRRRELGLRPGRRLLRRRHAGALARALPHGQLRDRRAAGGGRARISRARPARAAIFGHSMGGHGALVCALRNPERTASVSAFAPIVGADRRCPGARRRSPATSATTARAWRAYDATRAGRGDDALRGTLLVDQGTADKFLNEQLRPELLRGRACRAQASRSSCAATPATTTATTSSRRSSTTTCATTPPNSAERRARL